MSTLRLRRHRSLFVALPVIVGLLATGCSSSGSQAAATTAVVDTEAATTSTTTVPATTTTTIKAPTTTKAPATTATPAPSPSATLADPPVSTMPVISLNPNVILALKPTVKTLTVQTSWTCAEAKAVGNKATFSWTTLNTDHVVLSATGFKVPKEAVANGSAQFIIPCGTSSPVKVTPYAANGSAGVAKSVTVTVGA